MSENISIKEINKHVQLAKSLALDFVKKTSKGGYLRDERRLLVALESALKLEKCLHSGPVSKLEVLLSSDSSLRSERADYYKLILQLNGHCNATSSFWAAIGAIDLRHQRKLLKSPVLENYRPLLVKVFREAGHLLGTKEDILCRAKDIPAHHMWIEKNRDLIGSAKVSCEKKSYSIAKAGNLIPGLKTKERRKLFRELSKTLKSLGGFAESEINAICINKAINDEVRCFKRPYEVMCLEHGFESEKVVNIIDLVSDHFHISHNYFEAKRRLLKLPYLKYADKECTLYRPKKRISFNKGFEMVRSVMTELGDGYLDNVYIDWQPRIGKKLGASCLYDNLAINITLNYTGDVASIIELAHELGHAVHIQMADRRMVQCEGYFHVISEIVSRFFEYLVNERLLQKIGGEGEVLIYHERLNDIVSTVFKNAACFNFETDLHMSIKKAGYLPANEIAALMNKHLKRYLGGSVKVEKDDGYIFVEWPHIRYFFHSYLYVLADLVGRHLYTKYKADPTFIESVKTIMKMSGTDTPFKILKKIGVDINSMNLFKMSLKDIDNSVAKLCNLL